MPANQTVSYLIKRFAEAGINVKHKHGQNFLVDLNLLRILVDAAKLERDDVILEIGTGTGSLTAHIAPHVAAVVTVEIDEQMFQLASEELYELPNVFMLQLDALRNKNNLADGLLDAVRQHLDAAPGRQFKLVANLPYNVATPILTNLLAGSLVPRSMTVTIQKELADRMTAQPGTKDYGALSIWVQSQCRVEIVRILPPTVFWPRPKVTSAILHIEIDDERRSAIPDLAFFHAFTRSMFMHRRKFLRSQLQTACKPWMDKAEVDAVLDQLNLAPQLRAEQLPVETMLQLCEVVRYHAQVKDPISTD
jgi:16S rRNA (adenine1518-N6/adenine1519-N6)-dimethyltransferase